MSEIKELCNKKKYFGFIAKHWVVLIIALIIALVETRLIASIKSKYDNYLDIDYSNLSNLPSLIIIYISIFIIFWIINFYVLDFLKKGSKNICQMVSYAILIQVILIPILMIIGAFMYDSIIFIYKHCFNLNAISQDKGMYSTHENKLLFMSLYSEILVKIAPIGALCLVVVGAKTLQHTKKQFDDTQIQKESEEIEKRFHENIKLFSSESESIRLVAIYGLWDFVKDSASYTLEDLDANNSKYKTHLKVRSYSEKILDIFCIYIQEQTHSEKYLKQYYPSMYKIHYPKQFKDAFGEGGEHNFLAPKYEIPSREIQTLLDLLVSAQDGISDALPVIKLNYKIDLNGSILKGITLKNFYFKNAILSNANFNNSCLSNRKAFGKNLQFTLCKKPLGFQECDLFSAKFIGANLHFILFNKAELEKCHFEYSVLKKVLFQKGEFGETYFNRAILEAVNFSDKDSQTNYAKKIIFRGSYLVSFDLGNMQEDKCDFSGINTLIGANEPLKSITDYHKQLPEFDTANRLLVSELSMFIEYHTKDVPSTEIKQKPYSEILEENKKIRLLLKDSEQQLREIKLTDVDENDYAKELWKWSESQKEKEKIQTNLKKYLNDFDDFGDQELEPEPETVQQN